MSTCRRYHNPVPMGWGDHVRWMHEHEDWRRSAGSRHAEARRGAAAMRSRAHFRMVLESQTAVLNQWLAQLNAGVAEVTKLPGDMWQITAPVPTGNAIRRLIERYLG